MQTSIALCECQKCDEAMFGPLTFANVKVINMEFKLKTNTFRKMIESYLYVI